MNPVVPYVIGLALQKEFKAPVAVCKSDGHISWLWDDYRVAIAKGTDYTPKQILKIVSDGMKQLRKTYPAPGAIREHSRR